MTAWPAILVWVLGFAFAAAARSQVVVSEFQAANSSTLRDEENSYEDWIEVANLGAAAVDLTGWHLTDEAANLNKWTFPATNLAPGRFLIVFASGKDRRVPGKTLHTNFKLSTEGEFLALVEPDGHTIATAFSPAYPPQPSGVSYGLPVLQITNTLIGAGSNGRFLVPSIATAAVDWIAPDFDDRSWLPVNTGVGYDTSGTNGWIPAGLIATDVGHVMRGKNASAYLRLPFVVSGLAKLDQLLLRIRFNDGFLAYLNGILVTDRNAPSLADGKPVADGLADWSFTGQQGYGNWFYGYYDRGTDADGTYDPVLDFNANDPHWMWNGGAWVLGSANPPWDMIADRSWHPNGENSGGQHWVIRRWVCEVSGTVTCHLIFAKENTACGNGATLRILHNGIERYRTTLAFNDATGIDTYLVLPDLRAGDFVDFALDPQGTDGRADDGCDGCTFLVTLSQEAGEGPAWNSTATARRSPPHTATAEEINLSYHKDLLVPGTNVLAIHGLNWNADDPDFLLLPEVLGVYLESRTNQSVYFTPPTPGIINGSGSKILGPIITDVQHTPATPAAAEDLLVLARITPSLGPVATASLKYRLMYGAEAAVAMHDDGNHEDGAAGDSVYAGRIPSNTAAKPGQMLRYYIVAADAAERQSRAPAFADPTRSPQFFGTIIFDPILVGNPLPVLHWFLQNPGAADSGAVARCSVFYEGEFYDNIGAQLHGQSSRGFTKKSYDLDFNRGNNFHWSPDAPRVNNLNLLTTWADKSHMRNILAHETYRDAGAPSHFAFAVRVQRNGAFFSVANLVENGGANFLERLGLDPNGALYKMYNQAESATGAEKKTRRQEGVADLQALIHGMGLSDTMARQAYLFDNLDVPEIINFLAAKIITADTDCCHKNYYLYRDSDGTGEWQAMPWDVDLSFGRVWTCRSPCLNYFDETLYTNQSVFVGSGNRIFTPVFNTPATRQMFLRRLRTLMDSMFQPPGTPAAEDLYREKILALRDQIEPDAALDLAKWGSWGHVETIDQAIGRMFHEFFPGRRTFLFQTSSVTNRGDIPSPQPTLASVLIHRLEYRPPSGNPLEEWLSITNANSYAVDLSGWRLSGGVRFQFKPGTVIPAQSGLFVSPNVKAFRARTTSPKGGERRLVVGPYDGNLSAWGESLLLHDPTGRLVSSHAFNGNPSDSQRYLRITEIHYHPAPLPTHPDLNPQTLEFIELRNAGPTTLDLWGVRFTEGIHFDFSAGRITNLPPGACMVLAQNSQAFALAYPNALNLAGQFDGNLDNGGELLRLEDRFGEKILEFRYDNQWHPATDGHGHALVIADDSTPWSTWGEPIHWLAAVPSPGWFHSTPIPPHPPSVQLLQPTNLTVQLAGSSLEITAQAQDIDGSIGWVRFFAGTNLLTELTAPPYAMTWSGAPAGVYQMSAVAVDNTGLLSTSAVVSVTFAGNHPPVARTDGFLVVQGKPIPLPALDLLANDSDPDGDALTLTGASPSTERGFKLTFAPGQVSYAPNPEFTGPDGFDYTIEDSRGATGTGRVDLFVYSGPLPDHNQLTIARRSTGYRLRYSAHPGRVCEVQRAPSLQDAHWEVLHSATAPAHGLVEFTDTTPPPAETYYRAVQR